MKGEDISDVLERERPRLRALSYRMLGSMAEAEDAVQESFARLVSLGVLPNRPGAFLTRVVTNLCLDQLRSARARREAYVGCWLPEPVIERPGGATEHEAEHAEELGLALLCVLERLSGLERAAFLLHDVFDHDFAEVSRILERSEAACRQLARRARQQVRQDRVRFAPTQRSQRALAEAFFEAVRGSDAAALQQLLCEDAVWITDAGSERSAARNPVISRTRVARFALGIQRRWPARAWGPAVRINGLPGRLGVDSEGHPFAIAVEATRDGRVGRVYLYRNPDKLADAARLLGENPAREPCP